MKIQVLKDDVINQIAAGEVVDRPFGIVRELLDNSVDAGATEIAINIQDGGQSLIIVSDNGCGLSKDDALLAFERHATSKVREAADLLNISSYGFRGEALSSIAAVSKVVLRTRTKECDAATEITISAGKILNVKSVAGSQGTQIEVHNLFFNLPARKKFLKATSTEERKIKEWVRNFALANPKVRFTLKINGKTVLTIPAVDHILERAKSLLGSDAVSLEGRPLAGVSLLGLLAHPESSQFDSSGFTIIVNGRVISDRMLIRAVKDGFGSTLKEREYPCGFLSVIMSPDMVDVNVHPQKSEVRFRNGRELFSVVKNTVSMALNQISGPREHKELSSFNSSSAQLQPSQYDQGSINFFSKSSTDYTTVRESDISWEGSSTELAPNFGTSEIFEFKFSELKYIGQLFKCYLLCQNNDEFVIVDMHAAHERVRFNQLRSGYRDANIAVQPYLIPETIKLNSQSIQNILAHNEILERFGFEIEVMGADTLILRAVPALLSKFDSLVFFKELASYQEDLDATGVIDRFIDYIAARAACHSSVRSGDILERSEVYALFSALDNNNFSGACPHGRPVVVSFKESEIEKWFGRSR